SSILSREDLKVVAAGEKGMRIRTAEEEALVEKSKRQHKRQRLLQLGIISGFLALIAVVFFAVQQLSSASEFEKAQRLEDLADQANDANEKLSYLSQSLQIDDSDSDRRAKFYQAYREHIFYEEVAYVPNLYKVAFSADGNFVTIATKKGEATTLQQYRLHHEQKEIELLHTFTAPPAADVQAMVYSGDGQRIFAGGNDHSLHVWDNQGRKESSHSFGKKNIEQLAVSYDGKVALLHLFGEQELILFDLEKGVEKKRIQMGVLYNNPSLDALYYSEKEQYFELYERRDPYRTTSEIYDIKGQLLNPYIFWGGEETEAINYQIAKDKIDRVNSILLRYESDLQNPSSSSLSKESQHLWTVNNEGYFRYWQMPTTFMEQIALPAEIIAVSDVAVMEAGNRTSVLIATLQNGVYSYELGQKEGFRKLNWIVENAIDMLGTAGNLLAINANRNDLAFYDFEAASKLFNTPEGHTEAITAIAISPSGERVATASQDKSIVIWNVQKGEKLHQATLEQAAIDLNYFKEKEQLLLLERYGTLEILDDASNNFGATKEIATNVADDLVAAIPLADETSIALPGKEVVYILQGDQMTPHALTKLNDSDDYNWIKNKHWEKNLPYFATFSSKEIYGFSGEGQPYFHYESPSNDIEQVSLWKDKLLIFNEEHLSIYQINRSIPEDYALPFETRN
ncbi:MAG: WD40 repeat domain-containing protein, partial [Bacteroidota bacterium]